MSDIRTQAKHDAEFDRLLLGEGLIDDWGHFTEAGMRSAYELGRRHGRATAYPPSTRPDTTDGAYTATIPRSMRR